MNVAQGHGQYTDTQYIDFWSKHVLHALLMPQLNATDITQPLSKSPAGLYT